MSNKTPRYLIKVTYISGPHEGKEHLLQKGGYVTDEDSPQWEDTTYASLGMAMKECRRLTAKNKADYEDERIYNQIRIKHGDPAKEFFIYELEKYEPYLVNPDNYCGSF